MAGTEHCIDNGDGACLYRKVIRFYVVSRDDLYVILMGMKFTV